MSKGMVREGLEQEILIFLASGFSRYEWPKLLRK